MTSYVRDLLKPRLKLTLRKCVEVEVQFLQGYLIKYFHRDIEIFVIRGLCISLICAYSTPLPSQVAADGGGRRLSGADGLEGAVVEFVEEAVVLALVGEGLEERHVAWDPIQLTQFWLEFWPERRLRRLEIQF